MKKKLLIAVIISAIFMGLLWQYVDWGEFLQLMSGLDLTMALLAFVCLMLANMVRAQRFVLFDPDQDSYSRWWRVTQLYNLMTASMPGGIGEAATAWLFGRKRESGISSVIAVLFFTRILDLAGLCLLVLAAIAFTEVGQQSLIMLIALGLAGAALMVIFAPFSRLLQFLSAFFDTRSTGLAGKKLQKVFDKLAHTANIRHSQRWMGLMYSLLLMLLAIASLNFTLLALQVNLSPMHSIVCMGVYAIFQIVPVQGIAGIGTQGAWWTLALLSSGYEGEHAASLGLSLHLLFYLYIALLALPAALSWLMNRSSTYE